MATSGPRAELPVTTETLKLAIDERAAWRSLEDNAAGRELIPEGTRVPLAAVRHQERDFSAHSAAWDGERLAVGFAGIDTVLHYELETADRWVVFRLQAVEGTRPERVVLVQLPVEITANVGRRLAAAWDEQTLAGLMAANLQVDCRASAGRFATLTATTQDAPGPRLEGAAAALIVCPTGQFPVVARAATHAFDRLTNEDAAGNVVKDTDLVRGSYWFLSFGKAEVDKVIEYCRRTGIRQVMLSSSAWCASPGHYPLHQGRYPRGRESLKAAVARAHEHGILVGMHCFASKIAKRDPYVTPTPDRRLLRGVSAAWQPGDGRLEAPLAEAVTTEQAEIRVAGDLRHWPGSSQVADRYWEGGIDKHKEMLLGEELVQYERIGCSTSGSDRKEGGTPSSAAGGAPGGRIPRRTRPAPSSATSPSTAASTGT